MLKLNIVLLLLVAVNLSQGEVNIVTKMSKLALMLTEDRNNQYVARTMSILHSALDAALSIEDCKRGDPDCDLRKEIAVFEAGFVVLSSLAGYNPNFSMLVEAGYEIYGTTNEVRDQFKDLGESVRNAAYHVLEERVDDGFNRFKNYEVNSAPNSWVSSDPNFEGLGNFNLPVVEPFCISNDFEEGLEKYGVDEIRESVDSTLEAAVQEVYDKGTKAYLDANPDAKDIVQLWNDELGVSVVNRMALTVLAKELKRGALRKYVKALLYINTVMFDAFIFCRYTKTYYDLNRPRYFINNGIGFSPADPTWEPFYTTDTSPEFLDAWGSFAGGLAALRNVVKKDAEIEYYSDVLSKQYNFASISDAIETVGLTDIYGGTNLRYSTFGGNSVSIKIADKCYEKYYS